MICISVYGQSIAQDTFQSELFAAETVLKYRSDLALTDDQVQSIKKIYNDNISVFNRQSSNILSQSEDSDNNSVKNNNISKFK